MRIFRKVIFVFLALLPLCSFVFGCFSAFRGTETLTDRTVGNITFTVDGSTFVAHTQDGTWIDLICPNIDGTVGNSTVPIYNFYRICFAITTFPNTQSVSFPRVYEFDDSYIDGKVFLVMYLFIYEFLVWLLDLLVDFVTWVPRKMKEVFE